MDMGVKLNLSYPAAKPASEVVIVDKAVEKPPVAPAVATTESESSEVDEAKVKAAAEDIQKFFHSFQRNLEFSIDETSGKVIVRVIASDSGEVIRQIPNAEVLKLAESLSDASHLLLNAKA